MLECVVNVSEGVDPSVLGALRGAAGTALLDLHSDPDHHRSVLTLAGPEVQDAARALAARAVELIDVRVHFGAHPRFGAVDVVPFVPLEDAGDDEALAARDDFARWFGDRGVPCFLYGPQRSLPEVRKGAFRSFGPDAGPPTAHPTAGACAIGARPVMIAYNLWIDGDDYDAVRDAARAMRGPGVRALALRVGDRLQLSFNLVRPSLVGPADVHERAARRLPVTGAELVGLVPRSVLTATPRQLWSELDLSEERTIEARLEMAGFDRGKNRSG